MLKQLSIRLRIALGILLMVVFSIIGTAVAFVQNNGISGAANDIATSWMPAINDLVIMNNTLSEHFILADEAVGTNDTSVQADLLARIGQLR